MRVAVILMLLIIPAPLLATDAASCSNTDIQTAINATSSGGTVNIPAGSCSWSGNVSITGKALTLAGAGVASTIVTTNAALNVTCSATNYVVVTGIKFLQGTSTDPVNFAASSDPQSSCFRFHHNTITETGTASAA